VAAAVALVAAIRRVRRRSGDQARALLAVCAVAGGWIAIDLAATFVGLPVLARFLFPAAALIGVAGGVGIGWVRAAAPAGPARIAFLAGAVAVVAIFAVPRLVVLVHEARPAAASVRGDLHEVLEHGHVWARARACGRRVVVLNTTAAPAREIAWRLALPMRDVRVGRGDAGVRIGRGIVIVRTRGTLRAELAPAQSRPDAIGQAGGRISATGRKWTVYEFGCPPVPEAG
jgi:hypothetical protein